MGKDATTTTTTTTANTLLRLPFVCSFANVLSSLIRARHTQSQSTTRRLIDLLELIGGTVRALLYLSFSICSLGYAHTTPHHTHACMHAHMCLVTLLHNFICSTQIVVAILALVGKRFPIVKVIGKVAKSRSRLPSYRCVGGGISDT